MAFSDEPLRTVAPGRPPSADGLIGLGPHGKLTHAQRCCSPVRPVLAVGFVAGAFAGPHLGVVSAQSSPKVFELRTYTAPEGKLADLHERFRDHTLRIFQKHGMTNVIYLSPTDAPLSQNTLVYLLSHQSREAAKDSWADFARRSRVEEGGRRVAGERAHRREGGVRVPDGHRLLADEVRPS